MTFGAWLSLIVEIGLFCGALYGVYRLSDAIADKIIARRFKKAVASELAYMREEQRKSLDLAARIP